MKKTLPPMAMSGEDAAILFDRVADILDVARGRVLHAINHETVTAYWLIGREIVHTLQGGAARGNMATPRLPTWPHA
jgi:hypothetical protein